MNSLTCFALSLSLALSACAAHDPRILPHPTSSVPTPIPAATPTPTPPCHCQFRGVTYLIRQNSRGAVYGVPQR